jgi:hypothetical protein
MIQCEGLLVAGNADPFELPFCVGFDPAEPLLPELAPAVLPAGISGGGGVVIDGDVGDTLALFSLPGPVFPGLAVTPGAEFSLASGLGDCANALENENKAAAATTAEINFIGTRPLLQPVCLTPSYRCRSRHKWPRFYDAKHLFEQQWHDDPVAPTFLSTMAGSRLGLRAAWLFWAPSSAKRSSIITAETSF